MNKLGKLQKKRDKTHSKEQQSKNELIFNEMYFKLRTKLEDFHMN